MCTVEEELSSLWFMMRKQVDRRHTWPGGNTSLTNSETADQETLLTSGRVSWRWQGSHTLVFGKPTALLSMEVPKRQEVKSSSDGTLQGITWYLGTLSIQLFGAWCEKPDSSLMEKQLPAQPAVLPAAVRQWPSADAWGGFGEESKPYSRYPPAPAPPCDVIPAVFLSDSPWWLFLLWPPPLTSWPKPICCSSRDIGAPKGTGKSGVRGQPAVVWDRLSEGLPAARCLGSIPAWQRCWK